MIEKMKKYTLVLIFIFFIFSCSKKNDSNDIAAIAVESTTSSDETEKESSKIETFIKDYDKLKKWFKSEDYVRFNWDYRRILKSTSNKLYKDSIMDMKFSIDDAFEHNKILRDSIVKKGCIAYFEHLNLPKLKSLNYENLKHEVNNYKQMLTEFDYKIIDKEYINDPYIFGSYISLQNKDKFILVTAIHNSDDAKICIYSIDSTFNKVDVKELEYVASECERFTGDFKYKNMIITEGSENKNTTFINDSTFNVRSSLLFKIIDEKSKKSYSEVGEESNITYRLSHEGKFIIIEDKSFKKDYVDLYYANEPNF